MCYPKDEILIKSVRDGLVDEVHSGFVVFADLKGFKDIKGEAGDYPFYMRSCAKPLQVALLIDYGMDKYYDMTEEEIAVCCASHAGEKVHTDVIEGLLKKIGLDESYLKCGLHEPLSKTRQKELFLLKPTDFSPIYNNCSGKHTMMLGLCKMNGWDLDNYYKVEHPLQIAIKKKIYELCEIEKDYPMTTDGCGVPIVSMPLHNMLKGYLNLFCNDKYIKIRDAFLNNPYLIGGEDRTDTKIMLDCNKRVGQAMLDCCKTLKQVQSDIGCHPELVSGSYNSIISKVGAGGLCVVVNFERREAFVVKVSDCDMKSREFVAFGMINRLSWSNVKLDTSIKTLHGHVVGNFSMDF